MRTKSEIRRRRQARIEQILENQLRSNRDGDQPQWTGSGAVNGTTEKKRRTSEPPLARSAPDKHRSYKDPEEAWKERQASWHAQTASGMDHDRDHASYKKPPIRFPAWGGISFASLFASVTLFILIWGLFQIQDQRAWHTQMAVSQALTDPFQTEQAAALYKRLFGGNPSWIPALRGADEPEAAQTVHKELSSLLIAPIRGKIVAPYTEQKQGVQIQTDSDAPVLAAAAGRVVFSGYMSTGLTVVIQHRERVQTVYSMLAETAVEDNDWVEQGDMIAPGIEERNGSGEGVLYFSVREGERYVDPAEVVDFD